MNPYQVPYQTVIQRIAHSCEQTGRSRTDIRWMAVTKTRSAQDIRYVYELGVRDVGENYLQESLDKMDSLQALPLTWHFIGGIQSNKASLIATRFDWVHSVDRIKILKHLNQGAAQSNKQLNVCVQLNIDRETQKSGALIEELPDLLAEIAGHEHLVLRGFMCIPHPQATPAAMKPAFHQTYEVFKQWQAQFTLDTLSMGMSSDMHVAIECGATLLRIGTQLFGPRS